MNKTQILVVDDEPDIRELVKDILEDEGFEVTTAKDADSAREARRARKPDLILLDIWMPDTDGISLLKEWSASSPTNDLPVIMMSGHGTVETAVEATRLGAYDFLEKPLSMAKLNLTIRRALETAQLREENVGLRDRNKTVSEPIGKSTIIQAVRDQAKRIATHDTPVLIAGESGSGKEVFARYIHSNSSRRSGSFVKISVAALTGGNSSIELFGTEEGKSVHYGLLDRASGGTIFLEDVSDMDISLQAKILATMRDSVFTRVGGIESVDFNVRVIAATSLDLAVEVENGTFREDFFYQLNVVPLKIPPLREHREDIPELLDFHANRMVSQEGMTYRRFSVAGQNRLRNYDWPGNVRELENIVQRLFILGTGSEIGIEEIDVALGRRPRIENTTSLQWMDLPLREAREQFEKNYLCHQIRISGGNVSEVAKRIEMERTHLYRKLRALGIDPKLITAKQ